jgi:asparagine synthase (glutamine-hydrolysing)
MRSAFDELLPPQIAWRKDKIGYEPPQKKWLESSKVKERIHESKRKLYGHNIISKKEYEKNIDSVSFSHRTNKSWALWMAANLL